METHGRLPSIWAMLKESHILCTARQCKFLDTHVSKSMQEVHLGICVGGWVCFGTYLAPSLNIGSTANRQTRNAIITLAMPIMWKAARHPAKPRTVVPAKRTEKTLPKTPPMLAVNWSHPKATPRLSGSAASATKDWMAGMTMARPIPLRARDMATFMCQKQYRQLQNQRQNEKSWFGNN